MSKNVAVVLAGGVGARVGLSIPKQLIKIAGRTILEHTLAAIHSHELVDEVVIMMAPGHLDAVHEILRSGDFPKVTSVLEGAATRNGTTARALAAVSGDDTKVLLHDAVRPLVDARIITDCFEALDSYRNGVAAPIVAMLASAASMATAESWQTAARLGEMRQEWRDALGGTRPGTPVHRLLDLLTEEPIVNVALVSERLALPRPAVEEAITTVVDAKVLARAPRSRRAPVWLARPVLNEVEDLSTRIQAASRRLRER